VTRVLVALSVLAPVLVGGTALLLVAKAVAGSWLWGGVVLGAFLVAYAVALVLFTRWAKRRPRQADEHNRALAEALAFGLGGMKPRPKADDPNPR